MAEEVGGCLLLAFPAGVARIEAVGDGPAAVVFNVRGGYEFMLLVLVVGAGLVLTGPGAISVDAVIGFSLPAVARAAILVLAIVGALAAVLPARPPAAAGGSR